MRSLTLPLVAHLLLIGGCDVGPLPDRCRVTDDCRAGRVCIQDRCQFPDAAIAAVPMPRSDGGPATSPIVLGDGAATSAADAAEFHDAPTNTHHAPTSTPGTDAQVVRDTRDAGPSHDLSLADAATIDTATAPDAPVAEAVTPREPTVPSLRSTLSFRDMAFVSPYPTAFVSPRPYRMDLFAIHGGFGTLNTISFRDGENTAWDTIATPVRLTGGVSATSWSAIRWDVAARTVNGTVLHAYFELDGSGLWETEEVGRLQGSFRPAIVNTGVGSLLLFQVDATNRIVHFTRRGNVGWGPWREGTGPSTPFVVGLSAARVRRENGDWEVALVSQVDSGALVTARFDESSSTMGPWTKLPGALKLIGTQPAVVSWPPKFDAPDIYYFDEDQAFYRRKPDGVVEEVGRHSGLAIDVDVAVWSDGTRMDVVRRLRGDNSLQGAPFHTR